MEPVGDLLEALPRWLLKLLHLSPVKAGQVRHSIIHGGERSAELAKRRLFCLVGYFPDLVRVVLFDCDRRVAVLLLV